MTPPIALPASAPRPGVTLLTLVLVRAVGAAASVAVLEVATYVGQATTAIAVVGVIGGSWWLGRRWPLTDLMDLGRSRRLIVAAVVVCLVGAFLVWFDPFKVNDTGDSLVGSSVQFVGLALVFFGAGALVSVFRARIVEEHRRDQRPRIRTMVAVGLADIAVIAAAVVGTVGLDADTVLGIDRGGLWLVGAAVLLGPMPMAISAQWVIEYVAIGRAVLVAAAVVGIASLLVLEPTSDQTVIGLGVAALAGLTVAIVVPKELDTLLVIAVLALSWSTRTPSVEPPSVVLNPLALPDSSPGWIAAVGDSYLSGEGADEFLTGTNRSGTNECRRAVTSAVVRVAVARGTSVLFAGCSGARSVNITSRDANGNEPPPNDDAQYRDEPPTYGSAKAPFNDGGESQIEQLERVATQLGDPAVVFVSIGGNDAGFSDLATTCLAPGDCSSISSPWFSRLAVGGDVYQRLSSVYQAIRLAVPSSRVIVVPYPNPIAPTACESTTLTAAEHQFLHRFTDALNALIDIAADEANVEVVSSVAGVFQRTGTRLCDGDSASTSVNWLELRSISGSTLDLLTPSKLIHNSLHPTPAGHALIANELMVALDAPSVPDASADGCPMARAVPLGCSDAEDGPFDPPDIDTESISFDETTWMLREARSAILSANGLALTGWIGAWWVLTCAVIQVRRRPAAGSASDNAATSSTKPT
jgi:lysophospholipase L1-like esterase